MESEFQNEVPQYRSIVQEEGVLAAMFKVVQDANVKSEKIRNDLFDPKITENVSCTYLALHHGSFRIKKNFIDVYVSNFFFNS